MNPDDRTAAADALLEAYGSRQAIAPLTDSHEMSIDDAYAVQLQQVQNWTAAGQRVVGHKVGLTTAVVQRQLGVNQPDFGHLMNTFELEEFTPIGLERFIQPKVEPELALLLDKPLKGPGVTIAEAANAVGLVFPALEIVDSRIKDWKITIFDTIADNASSGGFVIGGNGVPLSEVDTRLGGCVLTRNGRIAGTGANGAVLGNPLRSLAWLANILGERDVTLEAGEIVLPGSVTPMSVAVPGDTYTATFAGIGAVTANFAKGETA